MKNWQVSVVIFGAVVVGLGLGVGASFYTVNSMKKDEPKIEVTKKTDVTTTNTVSPTTSITNSSLTVTQESTNLVASQPEKWTGEITLRPKDVSILSEKIVKSSFFKEFQENCGSGAKVFYKYKDSEGLPTGPTLKISNKNIEMSITQKVKFNDLYEYIKNEKTSKQELAKILFEPSNNELIFSGYCEPAGFSIAGIEIVDEIKSIKISNVDHAITFGNNIYATKGDNLLKYSGNNIVEQVNSTKFQKECQTELNNFTNVDGMLVNCISKKSIQLPSYEKKADQNIQELLTTFAL
jgi:hypothetical protein